MRDAVRSRHQPRAQSLPIGAADPIQPHVRQVRRKTLEVFQGTASNAFARGHLLVEPAEVLQYLGCLGGAAVHQLGAEPVLISLANLVAEFPFVAGDDFISAATGQRQMHLVARLAEGVFIQPARPQRHPRYRPPSGLQFRAVGHRRIKAQ